MDGIRAGDQCVSVNQWLSMIGKQWAFNQGSDRLIGAVIGRNIDLNEWDIIE